MCCHQLFIYATCGHSTFGLRPLVECRNAGIEPDAAYSTMCELTSHPYKSMQFDRLCPPCQWRRDSMLERISRCQQLEVDEYKWRVSYAMPAHGGKDYWTKKMESKKAAEEAAARAEVKEHKQRRFSWKRKSRKEG